MMILAIVSMIAVLLFKQFYDPKAGIDNYSLYSNKQYHFDTMFDSINICLASYGFLLKFVPVYAEMKESNYKNGMLATFYALIFVFCVYAMFAFLALRIYGSEIHESILGNFNQENDILTAFVMLIFCICFIMALPFNFFPGKLFILNVIHEYRHQSFSNKLMKQVKHQKNDNKNKDDEY